MLVSLNKVSSHYIEPDYCVFTVLIFLMGSLNELFYDKPKTAVSYETTLSIRHTIIT